MPSRSQKIFIAALSVVGLLTAIIAVNAHQSWRPVPIPFLGSHEIRGLSLPIAWHDNDLWLLAPDPDQLTGQLKGGFAPWRTARNWNRQPFTIMRAASDVNMRATIGDTKNIIARSSATNSQIEIWQGKHLFLFKEPTYKNRYNTMEAGPPHQLSLSPNGKRLAIATELFGYSDYEEAKKGFRTLGFALFNPATGKQIVRHNAVSGGFTNFAWSPDSREVAGIAADGWVFVLDANTGKLRLKFRAHQLFGAQIAWSPDGKTLVTATNPRLPLSQAGWTLDYKGQGASTMSGPSVTLSVGGKDKQMIVSDAKGSLTWNGRTERLLKRFDARTGKPIGSPLPLKTGAADLAFSPDGKQLAIGEHEFALILDAQTLAIERRLDIANPSKAVPASVCVAWSQDGATLATSTDRGITLWRMR